MDVHLGDNEMGIERYTLSTNYPKRSLEDKTATLKDEVKALQTCFSTVTHPLLTIPSHWHRRRILRVFRFQTRPFQLPCFFPCLHLGKDLNLGRLLSLDFITQI